MRIRSPLPVTAQRNTTVFGEKTWVDIGPVDIMYKLDAPRVIRDSGDAVEQEGRLYTARGEDLKKGDRVVLPEGTFGVIEGPWPNFDHPMSGRNLGLVRYHIRRGG